MNARKPGTSAEYDPQIRAAGCGPLLVFVPGMDGTGSLFYRQTPRLAQRYRVVTYRLRDGAESMDVLTEDLRHVIRREGGEDARATLVGESFGGTLALSFAIAYPNDLEALVVLNSFPYFRPRLRLHLARAAISAVPWGSMQLVRRLTAFRLHSRHTHRDDLKRFLELTRETTKSGYVNRLRILVDYDVRDRLQEIRAPTLFLASEQDHLVPAVEQAQLMAQRVPDAVALTLAGHGHICMIAPGFHLDAIVADWRERSRADPLVR
jgi:pimeloyl-ACP methyl ester carboxylesterase